MAKAAGSGYRSPINLNLSQLPTSTDPAIFNALLDVYNAIHILNAALDSIRENIFGDNKDMAPDESMRFIRTLWLPTTETVVVGDCVRWNGNGEGVRLGQATSTTMFVLSAGEPGDIVHLGIGPAVIKIEGAPVGKYYWVSDDNTPVRGKILDTGELDYSCIIGRCFHPDYILFNPPGYNTK